MSFSRSAIQKQDIFIAKEKEQSHIVIGFPGIDWYDKERPALDILSTVLGGSGGRLFSGLEIRKLAYNVSPILTYGVEPGVFGVYLACGPEKVEQALASMQGNWTSFAMS